MFRYMNEILKRTIDQDKTIIPPKMIYNEDWLLRFVLLWFSKQQQFIENSDEDRLIKRAFSFQKKARCYTQATLETRFKRRIKGKKDPSAEANSQVSGLIGHFRVKYGKKKEKVIPVEGATQFIAIDALMDGELSKGFKSHPSYHQVARVIGCIVNTIQMLEQYLLESSGYYIIAPMDVLRHDSYRTFTYRKTIEELINNRVKEYGDEEWLEGWNDKFLMIFQRIEVECISWEEVIRFIKKNDADYGLELETFYEVCKTLYGL